MLFILLYIMEIVHTTKTLETRLYCSNCNSKKNQIEMKWTEILQSLPLVYIYNCPNCGFTKNSLKKYPLLEYQHID